MSENLQQEFDLSTTAGKLADFYARRERSFAPSGEAAIEKQHATRQEHRPRAHRYASGRGFFR